MDDFFLFRVSLQALIPLIRYALTVNPIIYTSCIQQFWATAKANTVNGERQIQALIDKKKVIIMESSIRSDLHLEDAGGTDCLPTATIFEELARMGYEKPSQKLTFYKAFFSPQWKFLIHTITQCLSAKSTAWNEFSSTMASLIICLATNQKFNLSKYIFDAMLGDMSHHKKIYVNPSHTKKIFANMRREGKDFSGRITPLFETMMVQPTQDEVTQEETQQDDSVPTPSNDPPLSGEDSMQLSELMLLCTNLQKQVLDLEKAKDAQAKEIAALKKRRVESSEDKESLGNHEDASKQERSIEDIDKDDDVSLVDDTQGRKKEEKANIALIESWDNTQAMMEVDFELAQRLQAKEQGEITIKERSRLFVELMNKRKKHFAMLRAEEKRRKPPTKAQKRNLMSTYLKNIGGYKHNQLKSKSYEEIQKMFDNEMRRVNTFLPINSEVVKSKKETEESSKGTEDELESDKSKKAESSEEKAKGSRKKILGKKRAGKEQQQESSKRQRMEDDKETDEHEEVEVDDEAELKKHLVIVKDDDIAIDAIPLATKPPVIVEYKLLKEGIMVHYQLIRADGSSKRYSSMIRMLQDIDREDLETLWKLVKTKHGDTRPEDEHERVLWGDLKVMFEPDIKSDVLRNRLRIGINKQGTAAMEKLVEKLENVKEKAECKKLKKELEEARLSNTFLRMQNERVERDLYWTRVRAHEFYQEMIRRGFVFEERPNEAIDVPIEDEKSPLSEPRGSPPDV
ncbi:hypothetical protein Tco_1143864 [Tanacetum coccineum]